MELSRLQAEFGEKIQDVLEFRGELTVTVAKEALLDICRFLKEDESFAFVFLSDLCGVDRSPALPRFAVVYNLYSLSHQHRLRLKVLVDENELRIDSVVPIWETANWLERECFDLYGIHFDNHPDLRRILLPDNFEGYPFRKDYPLEGF